MSPWPVGLTFRRPALAVAATLLAGAWVVAIAVQHHGDDFRWAEDGSAFLLDPVAVGVVCGLAGAVAWSFHPRSPVGPLLTATGLLWLAQLAPLAEGDLALTVGALALGAYAAPLVHVALALPDGVQPHYLDRGVLVAVYGFTVVHSLINAMFAPSIAGRSSLLQVGEGSMSVIEHAGILYLVPVAAELVVLVLVAYRWFKASPVSRRATGLVVLAAVLTLGYLCVGTVFAALSGTVAAVSLIVIPVALVAALLLTRSRRVAVDDLVVGLGADAASDLEALRAVLARALGDPSIVLMRSDREELLPADLERRWPTQHILRLVRRDRTVGALVHDPRLADERRRLDAVAAVAALVLDNALLADDLARQLKEVSTSRERIVAAGDAQRRRLEQDLHDGAQQRLVSVALLLQIVEAGIRTDPPAAEHHAEVVSALADAVTELSAALTELRELTHGLAPATLTEHGLAAAVEALVDRLPIQVTVACAVPARLAPAVETAAYYLVAEAVTNAVKHAAAERIAVQVTADDQQLTVSVRDDGVGGADPTGFGVMGMSDRATALGGTFRLTSRPGAGTEVSITLPTRRPDE